MTELQFQQDIFEDLDLITLPKKEDVPELTFPLLNKAAGRTEDLPLKRENFFLRRLLVDVLSYRYTTRTYIVDYCYPNRSVLRIEPGRYLGNLTWNIYSDVRIQYTPEELISRGAPLGTQPEPVVVKDVWLAAIPRLDQDLSYTFSNTGQRYSASTRLILKYNKICYTYSESTPSSYIKSSNPETLESRSVHIYLDLHSNSRLVLDCGLQSYTKFKVADYIFYKLRNTLEPISVISKLLEVMFGLDRFCFLILKELQNTVVQTTTKFPDVIFPHVWSTTEAGKIENMILVDDKEVPAEVVITLEMVYVLISNYLKGSPSDDYNSIKRVSPQSYFQVLALLIRKRLRDKLLVARILRKDELKEPLIYKILVDAFVNNSWSGVISAAEESELRLSRVKDSSWTPGLCQELIRIAPAHSGLSNTDTTRLVSPDYLGYICPLYTPDTPDSAGLKQMMCYFTRLASDVIDYKEEVNLLPVSQLRDILRKEVIGYELANISVKKRNLRLWLHDFVPVMIAEEEHIIQVLERYKLCYLPFLCWNFCDRSRIIHSRTSYDRLIRPLIISLRGNACKLIWTDPEEEPRLKDIITPKYPFSYLAYTVPCFWKQNTARSLVGLKMNKNSVSASPAALLPDSNKVSTLLSPQRPLVENLPETKQEGTLLRVLLWLDGTAGLEDDSYVINEATLQRGALSCLKREVITWEKEDDTWVVSIKQLVNVGDRVKPGQSILWIKLLHNNIVKLSNIKNETTEICKVESIELSYLSDIVEPGLLRAAVVKLSYILTAQRGSKISSQNSQKGVISQIRKQEDLPWTFADDGSVVYPDLLMNPLGLASRATAEFHVTKVYNQVLKTGGVARLIPHSERFLIEDNKGAKSKYTIEDLTFFESEWYHPYTGELIEPPLLSGFVFFTLQPNSYDSVRVSKKTYYDQATGIPLSTKSSGVRIGWQDLLAMLQKPELTIAKAVFQDPQLMVELPLCPCCKKVREAPRGNCEVCNTPVRSTMRVSRKFVVLKQLAKAIGVNIDLEQVKGSEDDE